MKNMIRSLFVSFVCCAAAVADVVLHPTQDRDVYQGTGLPTGTAETLGVSSSGAFGGGHSQKSLIQFEVTEATAGVGAAELGSATLRLYVMQPEVYPRGYDIGGTVKVFFQESFWLENDLYWASFDEGALVNSFVLEADRDLGDGAGTWVYPIGVWVEVDVTEAVRGWLDGSVPNHGLVLAPDETGSPYLSSVFADSMTGFKPELVIRGKAVEFKVTRFDFDGTNVALEWSSRIGKTYLVRESVDLETWSPRDTVTATAELSESEFVGTVYPEGRAFYQVVEVD